MTSIKRRAAIYARFSTDLQNEKSTEDQTELCRAYAFREGLQVTATFEDKAKSGASIIGRDGLISLMAKARAKEFDILVVEHVDRISRNMRDLADIHEKFTFIGIEIRAVHSGKMDTAMIGLFGLVGQMQREDGAKKVRRGMAGVVRDGRHAGGLAYGYRVIAGKPGELEVEPAQAEIIRRIFDEYLAGNNPREIARGLNRDGIAPPRGMTWNATTINGNKARGHGILLNPIYAGRIVWNRVRMIKDPDTGRRVSRVNPESEWMSADAPHLRIVDEKIFHATQTRKADRSKEQPSLRQRPTRPLSGLLKCGACGAGMRSNGLDHGRIRIQCSTFTESRSCDNSRKYYLDEIEQAVLDGLTKALDDPDVLAGYVRAYHDERRDEIAAANREKAAAERRLGEVTRSIDRLIDAIADGTGELSRIKDKLKSLETEHKALVERIDAASAEVPVIALHPAMVERYLSNVRLIADSLPDAFAGGDLDVIAAFRELVERVIVVPSKAGEPVEMELRGRLSALIGADMFPNRTRSGGGW
jgi:site-specific DNA recombinase